MRLFVALDVPGPVARAVEEGLSQVKGRLPAARWVRRPAYHLTLAFLGERDPAVLPTLREHLEPAFAAVERFTLRLRDGGTFPPRRPARVAWVGVDVASEDDGVVARLAGRVHRALAEAVGFEGDRRPFSAHLTVARPRAPWKRHAVEDFTHHLKGPWGEPFRVEEGVLFESRLGPGGARYRALQRYPLGSAEGDELG